MKKAIFSVSSTVLFFLFTTLSHANPILSISPDTQTVSTGSSVFFDVNISGLGSGIALGGYDLNISFDSTLLSFNQAIFGDPLLGDQLDLAGSGLNMPSAIPGLGFVNLFEFSLDDPATLIAQQAGSFRLAVLSFNTLVSGISPLALSVNSLTDANANDIQPSIRNGSVTINGDPNTVPEPEALVLLMMGGLAFLLTQHRNRFI